MTWRRIGDKPLSESMLAGFTDIYAAQGRDELKGDTLRMVDSKRLLV